MMKRLLIFFSALCAVFMAHAETGSLVLEESLSIRPGEQKELKILLNNVNISSAAQATVVLPEGLSFVKMDWDGEEVWAIPSARSESAYSDATMGADGSITFAFLATAVRNRIQVVGDDPLLLTMTIKAADTAPIGIAKIKLNDVAVSYPAGSASANEDYNAQFDINIYQTYNVAVATDDAAKGTVAGGKAEAMSGTSITVTATPNTGYDFVAWTEDDAVVSTDAAYTFTPTKSVALTATFAPHIYQATFKSEGVADVVKDIAFGTALTDQAPTPGEKTGYSFSAWDPALPETMPAEDKTFTAQYTINQYKMTFKLYDGADDIVITQDYATALTAPTPTRTGYTFDDWDATVPTTIPAADQTFTAQWTINQYTMTFVKDNGETDVVKTQDYATALTAPDNPERLGYTFTGWTPEVPASIPAADATYTAQWTLNTYAITYNLDGGALADGVSNPESYTVESDDITLNNPTKVGYTFAGWTGTDLTAATTDVTILQGSVADRDYTATWTINKHTATFYDEDGVTLLSTIDDIEYDTPLKDIYIPADKVVDGNTLPFVGWNPEITDETTMPDEDVFYTAIFGGTFELRYIIDGEVISTESIDFGQTLELIDTTPAKEGYTFSGWSPTLPETMPAHDVELVAQWTINRYTVTFKDADGGIVYSQEQDYATPIVKPAAPELDGRTFSSWGNVDATVPAHNVTYTGIYTNNIYRLIYMLEDDYFKYEKVPYSTVITPLQVPEKEGYTFGGWEGMPATMPSHDVVVNGYYIARQYTVTFKIDDEVIATTTLGYGETIEAPEAPEKEGYTFDGWSELPATMPSSDVEVIGTYTARQYTVTFQIGDEVIATATLDYGTEIVQPEAPEKEGYTFAGWDSVDATVPAHDVTYTGTYNINSYTIRYYVGEELIAEDEVEYGATITLREYVPVDPRYSFNGWEGETYETMPAHDIEYHATLVDAITSILGNANADVWTLNGVLIKKNVPAANLRSSLPQGTYIINGKKINVK